MADDRPCRIVFDLDDTLYCERDFVMSGFRAAGDWLEQVHGLAGLEARCRRLFSSGRRARIFDEALAELGRSDPTLVAALVDGYRSHRPAIALAPDAARYLDRSPGRHAVITDGYAATQAAKAAALDLSRWIDTIIFTDLWGREFWKPHERAFAAIEAGTGLEPGRLIYVADNPIKDFVAPNRRGWHTVQICRPDRMHVASAPDALHRAHARIDSLDELDACIAALLR
jgi:putative hydrolase of the HAD superfamily